MCKVLLSLIATLTVLCLSSFAQTAGDASAMNPVGAWDVTVTPEPAQGRSPFNALHVYNFGGTEGIAPDADLKRLAGTDPGLLDALHPGRSES